MTRSFLITIALLLLGSYSVQAQCTADILSNSGGTCQGSMLIMTATPGGVSYQWYQDGNPIGTNSATLNFATTVPGSFQYTVEIDFGTCTDLSSPVTVSTLSLPVLVATNNNPTCGGTLLLTTNGCTGCTYQWMGPNGFTSTFQNPSIPNVLSFMNGTYTVTADIGGCTTAPATTMVLVQPGNAIIAGNNSPVCIGDTLHLTASFVSGATYSWLGPNNFYSTQQDTSFVVDSLTGGGVYTVTANMGCISSDTTHVLTCNTVFFDLYNDLNSNCTFEVGTDAEMFLPVAVEIDSNGIALDTISAIGGIFYTPLGLAGDIYSFKILDLPGDMVPTCPVTGIVDLVYQPYTFSNVNMGIGCSTNNNFDLEIYASNPNTSAVAQNGFIYVQNSNCQGVNATVTLAHSPKYQHSLSSPPAIVSGNVLTWTIPNMQNTTAPFCIYYSLLISGMPLLAGDTTNSIFEISPIIGDPNPNNNIWTKHDTVIASQDPNAIMAYPESCIDAGDQLQYTIMFENVGNAPAENIYVLDTLPAGLDPNTLELVMSSHNMFVQKSEVNGQTIFKFDFPNINLPDSSDHVGCHGQLVYNIKTLSTLGFGATIDHRAGIYFDYNSVVMTNTYTSNICVPNNVVTMEGNVNIKLYPNPATNELNVQTDKTFTRCTITNTIGQQLMEQELKGNTNLNIRSLTPGVYYIKLHGQTSQQVLKFIKL